VNWELRAHWLKATFTLTFMNRSTSNTECNSMIRMDSSDNDKNKLTDRATHSLCHEDSSKETSNVKCCVGLCTRHRQCIEIEQQPELVLCG